MSNGTRRRDFLKCAAGAGVAGLSPLAALLRGADTAPAVQGANRPGRRPNIVFILADDLGYEDVTCFGAKTVRTENIDRIAREGVRFTDAHSPNAICTPTRYATLSGRYAFRTASGGNLVSG